MKTSPVSLPSPAAVAVLGPAHTQSHEAAREHFPAAEAVLCPGFREAVERCLEGVTAFLPLHNRHGGAVRGVLEAAAGRPIAAVRYHLKEIRHLLCVPRGHAGGTAAVRRVRTKDQARLQCRERLAAILASAAYVDEASTVAPLESGLEPGDAVVVTPAACRAYGLEALAEVGPAGNFSLFALAVRAGTADAAPSYGPGAYSHLLKALSRDPSLAGSPLFPAA